MKTYVEANMLKWRIRTGDEQLKENIRDLRDSFEEWFETYWKDSCSKQVMLSEKSPVLHVYYKMTKSLDEIKRKFPYEALTQCSSCDEYVNMWIETTLNVCDEKHRVCFCKDCAENINNTIKEFLIVSKHINN